MNRVLIACTLVACSKGSADPKAQAETMQPPAETKAGDTIAAAKPIASDSDDEFRAAVTELAKARRWVVDAWGAAELDDRPGPDRWAKLWIDSAAANGVDDRGAYLVQAGDTFHQIGFDIDGRSSRTNDATWHATGEPFIAHEQSRHRGFDEYHLAIRGGQVVVLHEAHEGRNDDGPVPTDYANDQGACAKPCPKAADKDFTVTSAKTITELSKQEKT